MAEAASSNAETLRCGLQGLGLGSGFQGSGLRV